MCEQVVNCYITVDQSILRCSVRRGTGAILFVILYYIVLYCSIMFCYVIIIIAIHQSSNICILFPSSINFKTNYELILSPLSKSMGLLVAPKTTTGAAEEVDRPSHSVRKAPWIRLEKIR